MLTKEPKTLQRKRKVKGRKGETRCGERFGPPKNCGVAPLCQTLFGFKGPIRGGEGRERNGKGEEEQEGGKGMGGKLEWPPID